jgi:hypothetical protein
MGSFGSLFWKNKAKFLAFLGHPKHGNQEHLRCQQLVLASSLFWQKKPERDRYKKHTEPHSTRTLIEDNQRKDGSWSYQLHTELAMNIPYPASFSKISLVRTLPHITQSFSFHSNLYDLQRTAEKSDKGIKELIKRPDETCRTKKWWWPRKWSFCDSVIPAISICCCFRITR